MSRDEFTVNQIFQRIIVGLTEGRDKIKKGIVRSGR